MNPIRLIDFDHLGLFIHQHLSQSVAIWGTVNHGRPWQRQVQPVRARYIAVFSKSRRFEDIKYDTERDHLETTLRPLGDVETKYCWNSFPFLAFRKPSNLIQIQDKMFRNFFAEWHKHSYSSLIQYFNPLCDRVQITKYCQQIFVANICAKYLWQIFVLNIWPNICGKYLC